jgi:hypothetical protein
MGQFENLLAQPSHEMPSSARPQHLDFSSVLGESDNKQAPPARSTEQTQPARVSPPIDINQVSRSTQADQAPPVQSSYKSVDSQQDTPPRPDPVDSDGNKVGWYLTNGLALGAGGFAVNKYAASLRKSEIDEFLELKAVVKPESLAAMHEQSAAVLKTVADKSRAVAAEVDSIAALKPHAFEEVAEQMPAKKAGEPPTQLLWKRPKADTVVAEHGSQAAADESIASITPEEASVVDRSTYLRNLERRLVKDFDMANTTKVSAFRGRQPYLQDLSKNPFAEPEGLVGPLEKLESMSGHILGETTSGRNALDAAVNSKIMRSAAEIGGSFLATRGIDAAVYGSKSQGFLTTAFDVAAPFITFTKMSTVAKVGLMIGGHELVRAAEYMAAKKKEESESSSSN